MVLFWVDGRLHQAEIAQTLRNEVRPELSLVALRLTPVVAGAAKERVVVVTSKTALEENWRRAGFQPADEAAKRWLVTQARKAAGMRAVEKSIHEV